MVGLAHAASPSSADEAAIRAQRTSWVKAYNGGDAKRWPRFTQRTHSCVAASMGGSDVVTDHCAAFHHEGDVLQDVNVGQRIALDGDDVSEFACLHAADL